MKEGGRVNIGVRERVSDKKLRVKESMAESRISWRQPWKAEEIWGERDVGRGGHKSSLFPFYPVLPPPKPPAGHILVSFYLCLACLCPHSWFAHCTHPEPQVQRPFIPCTHRSEGTGTMDPSTCHHLGPRTYT